MAYTPHHQQTSLYGVDVDAGMAGLIETLWAADLQTQFSCEGDTSLYSPMEPTGEWAASITFPCFDDAARFLDTTVRLLGDRSFDHEGSGAGSFVLTALMPGEVMFARSLDDLRRRGLITTDDTYTRLPQIRALVSFPPSLLQEVTAAWESFAAPAFDYEAVPSPTWSIDKAWSVRERHPSASEPFPPF
ncbi:Uncharacterised protein [Mycolicibacterium fortuitum]|uniref:Uncharacterized protein n=1 Tax=Mycolicibacterium fortuitum TaxID=1766 RepID=A0A378WC28_MYCFO|nr:Uncharacterised protein [Mycolicibacterium fortuitum]